ncbi:radical SAM protein [Candidatus Sumerlaeota bacterium]
MESSSDKSRTLASASSARNAQLNGGALKCARRTTRYHLAELLGRRTRPLKLRLALTNRCNARCIMCSIWQFQDNAAPELPGELTVDEIRRLAQRNRRFLAKVTQVALTGGEPTLRRDFLEVARAVSEEFPGRGLSFNTNGFASQRVLGLVEQCLEFRQKLSVMVSLDGIGDAHNRVRGMKGNVYAAVRKTIDGLLALREAGRRLKLEINSVMTNQNADQLPALFEFCRERGLEFNPIYITFGQLYHNENADVALNEESRARLLEDARRMLAECPSLRLFETVRLLEGRPRDFDCWAGRLMLLVEENADVFPNGGCPPDFKLGNLREFDFELERLLDSADARAVLKRVAACRACEIPCESMTTLRHAEAWSGYRKCRQLAR